MAFPRDLPLVATALATLAAAVALTLLVAFVGAPLPGDRALLVAVQDAGMFDAIAPAVNRLGGVQWYVLPASAAVALVVAVALPAHRAEATWAAALLGGCTLLLDLDRLLKTLAGSPRPVADGVIEVTEFPRSFGFPSGHVYGDVLMLCSLASVAWRFLPPAAGWPVAIAAGALVFLAGPARMATGAHWPVDVLGGLLWGSAVLLLALVAARRAERLAGRRHR